MQLLLLIVALALATAFPHYGSPTTLDLPVTAMRVNGYSQVVVASDNLISYFDLNGTHLHNITLEPSIKIRSLSVSSHVNETEVLCSDGVVRWYMRLSHVIPLHGDFDGLWTDDRYSFISINYTYHDPDWWSMVTWFNDGGVTSTYLVKFSIADLIVNPNDGNIIFDNFVWNEPSDYIYVANSTGVITKINTTKLYPNSGLAVDSNNNIIAAGYGLDIYSYNGTFVKHLNPSSGHLVESPQVYQEYIVYLDMFTDGFKPFIQFIDYDGNKILKVPYADHPIYSYDHSYFYFTRAGDLIASIDDEVKIWRTSF